MSSESLLALLGLSSPVPSRENGASAETSALRDSFREVIGRVNEHLRSTAAYGPSDLHKEIAAQRDKLFSAYQKISKSPNNKELKAKLLAAVEALGDKAASVARDAVTGFEGWANRASDYESTLAKVSHLESAKYPGSAVLQKVVDALRARISDRDFGGAVQALDQIGPKLSSIYDEFTSSQQSQTQSQPGVAATATSSEMRIVPGAGGYEYEQHSDGAIFIVKSPIKGSARTPVEEGTTDYKAIVAEIGPFPSSGGGKGPTVPTPPSGSPGSSLPPMAGKDPGPEEPDRSPPVDVPASLEELMAKDELTAEEIAEARRLIAEQPQESQGILYEQLQEKAEYCNQRNNDSQEKSTGGTCNLTSVAMALEYLGVKNPYPQMDFDEALVKIAEDNNYGAITTADCWSKVAAHLGVKNSTLFASSVKQKREWWETNVDNAYLRKGYGVVMSLDGHIVRLQAITEAGLVVDDPYGASKLSGRTFDDGRPKYSFTDSNDAEAKDGDNGANSGDDTQYAWSDVEKYTFKYLMAFK